MGDAVRRVQKHLQELSRDHLTSVEDRHHANLGWLQIELQKLCKQIEVEVRVELTRPPRLSFSKPAQALLPATKDVEIKPAENATTTNTSTSTANNPTAAVAAPKPKTPVLPSPVHMAATRLQFDETEETSPSKKRRLDDTKKVKESETIATNKQAAIAQREVISVDSDSDAEVVTVVPAAKKPMVKRMVKRTRVVLKPKKMMKTEKKFVKEEKPVLPQVDVGALKVVDLKVELKNRGLKQTGVKAVLVKRLKEALEVEDAAQAEHDAEAGTWVTKEVVEEVLEEVEEEYEEEIEEEEAEQVLLSVDEEPVDSEQNTAVKGVEDVMDSENELTEDTERIVQEESADVTVTLVRTEPDQMSLEDVNASFVVTNKEMLTAEDGASSQSPQVRKSSESTTKLSSPKKSLFDMINPMSVDEIVRESADGFVSPDSNGKVPVKVTLARKSPRKKAQPAPAALKADMIAAPTSRSPDPPADTITAEVTSSDVTKSFRDPREEMADIVIQPPVETSAETDMSENDVDAIPQPRQTVTVPPSQVRDEMTKRVPSSKQSVSLAADKASTQHSTTTDNASGSIRSKGTEKSQIFMEAMTPSRDLMERVRSLASSSQSSSVSSITAARRYTGSVGFVEDSQPDQSLNRMSAATEFSTQSTRAVSTSQLELESTASRAKTPDSATSVPPPSERVAQSEPRLHAAKPQVENEAERKRREQQENIQREAQRLRLAMKQSAKKRFEESKSTTLFWKRDQQKVDNQAEVSLRVESATSTSTPDGTTCSLADSSHPTKRGSANTERVASEPAAEVKESVSVDSSSSVNVMSDVLAQSKSKPQAPPSEPLAKKESQKQSLPTRKRSSIVLDSSRSTLYPSKKRASITRGKEVEPTAKRTSLTKTTSPAQNLRKRSSTERVPVRSEAPKRKRSSEPRDKPADVSIATKRKSVSSSQSDELRVRADATSGSSISQKLSRVKNKFGVSSSTTAKRKDSVSSTISSSSNASANESRSRPTASVMSGGAVRKPANLVSGLHSFTSLLEKDTVNLSSSQGSNTSTNSRQATGVSALKLAEKSRLLEQKKNLEKAKRKEALAKKYEEQRKADDEKRKKYALMKEKAERDARLKREQEQATEKKQRELELAKKRQQRLQEMRSGMEKKKAQGGDKDQVAAPKVAVPVSRTGGATTSATSTHSTKVAVQKSRTQQEVTTYAMSENEESSESEDEKDTERNAKNIPKWAQRENLERTLRMQFGPNAADPTPSIFPDFVDSCDLEAIFEPTDARKKKRFQRRTSSGNWLGDRPTAREKAVYKKDMGFQR